MLDLNDRKRKILQAVIDEYIGTAEPVGSRAIAKRDSLNLSSATIRNEMADLEDMGYLIQPHASAGRIPSDEGYRFYVNSLMTRYRMEMEAIAELQKAFQLKLSRLDQIIKYAGSIASSLTDYTTFVTGPERGASKLRKVDLVPISSGKTMVIVVTESVRSQVMNADLTDEECSFIASAFNKRLAGLTPDKMTPDKIQSVSDDLEKGQIDKRVLSFVYDMIISEDDAEVYVLNAKSILNYPEYRDVKKAGQILSFLDNKENLKRLAASNTGTGVMASIGAENEDEILKDCSLVTVDYSLGDGRGGKIGVIGPKRMNYSKVFASLDVISDEIDKILRYYTQSG